MRSLQLLFLAGTLASALGADTIVYDNILESSAGSDGIEFAGPLYDSFALNSAGQIDGLQLILSGDDSSSGEVDVGLYADNSTSPGELLFNIGRFDDSALSSTPATYDLAVTGSQSLASNIRYWIGLTGLTTAEWYYTGGDDGSEFFSNQTGVYSDSLGPYQMTITAGISSAPEPRSGTLRILSSVAVMLLFSRRGRLRSCGRNK
jgi:hypothetical protein